MAPLIPRMHLWEIDDQSCLPLLLPAANYPPYYTTILNRFRDIHLPLLSSLVRQSWPNRPLDHPPPGPQEAPSEYAADRLVQELGADVSSYTYIDFCAGGGGPTPSIEKAVNDQLRARGAPCVDFVLTDLYPNVGAWTRATDGKPHISYEAASVDASDVPKHLFERAGAGGKKVMRLFNLAFHHFDDPLATKILKNTVETSDGFAIFELQGRDLTGLFGPMAFGLGGVLLAPFYALLWRSPIVFFFSSFIPIIPFVLMFDGWISALRTRTPDEVEALLRSCGADTSDWEVRSGSVCTHWPVGYMHWIICRPVKKK
ncbi:hypothetical protein B0I35DRAFT_478030 [Stachybotrys elegans]|uniref:Methyltransferase domain-containing protein n=1 Tax=Stachybotrys elegans TaxID=80388 RepID=A0A8K0SSA2_9HYPO|nr:hypothetical protein B0I35DRAFT_478030 [Stachybotrys elegans]